MIIAYHRPKTLEEAIQLLSREEPKTVPIAGGTSIRSLYSNPIAVVDLQDLSLTGIEEKPPRLKIGSMTRLQTLQDYRIQVGDLYHVIQCEATYNLRQVASVAGTLVASDGRSPFTLACLAYDATLMIEPGSEECSIGDFLLKRNTLIPGRIITMLSLPLSVSMVFESISKTPFDQSLVCIAACQWKSGRTRIAVGGFGPAPRLAFDGPDSEGVVDAVESAFLNAGDWRASAEYRSEVGRILVQRCNLRLMEMK